MSVGLELPWWYVMLPKICSQRIQAQAAEAVFQVRNLIRQAQLQAEACLPALTASSPPGLALWPEVLIQDLLDGPGAGIGERRQREAGFPRCVPPGQGIVPRQPRRQLPP
jgi:hypothetical protein